MAAGSECGDAHAGRARTGDLDQLQGDRPRPQRDQRPGHCTSAEPFDRHPQHSVLIMNYQTSKQISMRWNSRLLATITLAASTITTGCGDIFSLKQENPSQLTADAVYTPANAQLLVNGAIADFECAFYRYVVGSALLGDELQNAFANSNNYDYDRRTLFGTSPYAGGCGTALNTPGVYTSLATARGTADEAYNRLNGWTDEQVPNRARLMGQVTAYAGYSLILLGEGLCT